MIQRVLVISSTFAALAYAGSIDCTNPEHLRTAGKITLGGSALGGELYFGGTWSQNPAIVRLNTTPLESAASVAARLASLIDDAWGRGWRAGACCLDSTIYLSNGMYFLAGTETGLGIPRAPRSLTTHYDRTQNRLSLAWENYGENYDSMTISFNWGRGELYPVHLMGSHNSFEVELSEIAVDLDDVSVWVVGYRDLVPSPPSITRITAGGRSQEELYGAPHTMGIPPNWTSWQTGVKGVVFQQMVREESVVNRKDTAMPLIAPRQKPYWLRICTIDRFSKGGIWRKYIGLKPGHTYRINARISCGDSSGNDNGDWSVSFHALPADSDHAEVLTEQLQSLAPLSEDSVGPDAREFASFTPGNDTGGEFALISTENLGVGNDAGDITLPLGTDAILVWLRVVGKVPSPGVGFDWIQLQDVTE